MENASAVACHVYLPPMSRGSIGQHLQYPLDTQNRLEIVSTALYRSGMSLRRLVPLTMIPYHTLRIGLMQYDRVDGDSAHQGNDPRHLLVSFSPKQHGQAFMPMPEWNVLYLQFLGFHGQAQVGMALQQGVERDPGFHPREGRT